MGIIDLRNVVYCSMFGYIIFLIFQIIGLFNVANLNNLSIWFLYLSSFYSCPIYPALTFILNSWNFFITRAWLTFLGCIWSVRKQNSELCVSFLFLSVIFYILSIHFLINKWCVTIISTKDTKTWLQLLLGNYLSQRPQWGTGKVNQGWEKSLGKDWWLRWPDL